MGSQLSKTNIDKSTEARSLRIKAETKMRARKDNADAVIRENFDNCIDELYAMTINRMRKCAEDGERFLGMSERSEWDLVSLPSCSRIYKTGSNLTLEINHALYSRLSEKFVLRKHSDGINRYVDVHW